MQKHERTVTYYASALVLIKHDKKKEKKKKYLYWNLRRTTRHIDLAQFFKLALT